ncbi:hypothetical protein B0H13DRAFT_2033378 [Mycena leptocephala]|nr:hypothetical protein B0H13DRAFT_2064717 [Mycena leptocephala]KAJ7896851.1 hypothetical protein B0H13DRAFT_2033378 [Mycena leptocephala]
MTCTHRSFWIGLMLFVLGWWNRCKKSAQGCRILWAGISDRSTRTYDTIVSVTVPPPCSLKMAVFHPVWVCAFTRTLLCSLTNVSDGIIARPLELMLLRRL